MLGNKGQSRALLEHLIEHGSITSKEAFELYGITRLSSHLWVFRKHGYNIKTTRLRGTTRYGTSCSYGVFTLVKKEDNNEADASE